MSISRQMDKKAVVHIHNGVFSSVQSLSRIRLFATPRIAACQASLSITISWSSLRLTSIESVMPSSHLNLCFPLLLPPPIPPNIRVFSNLALISFSSRIAVSRTSKTRLNNIPLCIYTTAFLSIHLLMDI